MHKSKHHKNASFSYKEALSKILATGPYLLISCLFLAITSPVNGQENPCGETMVKLPYEISRTSPVNGGSLPADEPVLIEMIAPSMVLDAPEQQIEPITYKELYVGPLPFGVVHSLQTLRSDYGTTRYLGGDTLHWEPTSWDAPMERRVLVIIRLMELLDDGTVAPASFVEGSSYTVAMKIADINGEPGTYIDYEFSFTAEAPKGALALDTVSSELTVNLQESCETTDLDCESDPDTCDIQCANAAELARIGVETTFSPLSMENDRSLAFRASLSTHSYSWVSVLFPGEQNDAWTASLATFHGGGSIPDEACASVSMGSPGLPPVAEFETCAEVNDIPPCNETGPVVADEDENEQSDISEPNDTQDTASSEDTTTEDEGQSPPSFLTDTHLSNPNSRADSDGFAPDQSADDVGITGTNYDNPSYDGCACDLTRSKQDRWRESLFLVLAISLGLGLLRSGNKNPRDVR